MRDERFVPDEPPAPARNPWTTVGLTMFVGLFVAFLDRSALSVGLPELAHEFGFAGTAFAVVSSAALTVFNVGYAVSNIAGGFLTRRLDPKVVVVGALLVWSAAVILTGFVGSIIAVIVFRAVLGVAEGVYWPQQSRLVAAWFDRSQLTRANSVIQYHGQYLSLAVGFVLLTWLDDAAGWRSMFVAIGGAGLLVALPLMLVNLRRAPRSVQAQAERRVPVRLASLGGPRFALQVASYFAQGMLFWGLTLWLPLAVAALGFTATGKGLATAVPYLAAVVLALPLTWLSDRTGKRVAIASAGLLVAGLALVPLAVVENPLLRLALITVAMGYYAASFTPNIWAIVQSTVDRNAIGAASGIINGIGAGCGGVVAGWLVGLLKQYTGSYIPGFVALGVISIVGALCLWIYGRLAARPPAARPTTASDPIVVQG